MSSTTSITIVVKSDNNKPIYDYLSNIKETDLCGVSTCLCAYEPLWEVETDIMVMAEIRGTIEMHDLKTSMLNLFAPFKGVKLDISFENLEMGDYGKLSINDKGVICHYLDNKIVGEILNKWDDFYDGIYELLDNKLESDGETIKL